MLREVSVNEDISGRQDYPFSIPVIRSLDRLVFEQRVVFFVGENGTGKSTLLEALAVKAGFNVEGGSKNFFHSTSEHGHEAVQNLADVVRLSWDTKLLDGYFFRAESFFTLASELDRIQKEDPDGRSYLPYGGRSLHDMSHGQSFFALFGNRLTRPGFYLFDEPEAALSPQKQLSFLVWLHELIMNTESQCIIATHSPIIMAFPKAQIFFFDGDRISEVRYEETGHYTLTKDFLNNPKAYLSHLIG